MLHAARLTFPAVSSVEVELARRQWEEGGRAFDDRSRDPAEQERLLAAVEAVTDELRKRVGQTYTLAELAGAYAGAEQWVRETLSERTPFPGWPRALTLVQDAAFRVYARGATDYAP